MAYRQVVIGNGLDFFFLQRDRRALDSSAQVGFQEVDIEPVEPQALRFAQVENRLDLDLRLQLASQVPLVPAEGR